MVGGPCRTRLTSLSDAEITHLFRVVPGLADSWAETDGIDAGQLERGHPRALTALRAEMTSHHDRFVASLQAEFAHLTVVDGRRLGYERNCFIDPVHLDCDGAAAFTVAVAPFLRDSGAKSPGRWIDLGGQGRSSSSVASGVQAPEKGRSRR